MKIITLILSLTFTSACFSTGGTIAGLIPAPKIIKGEISNGIYTSPDQDFKIIVPNWNNKGEYQYMKMKEQISKTGEYLSFGPAVANRNIYRLEYAKKLDVSSYYIELKTQKDQIFKSYISQIEKAYKSKAELISEDVDLFKAKKSYSRIYRQHTPQKKKFFKTIAEDLRYHFIDLVDYGSYNILYWVTIPINIKNNQLIEEKLKNRDNSEYTSFINSFNFQKHSSKKMIGKVENEIYYSANNEFSVKIPHSTLQSKEDAEEWNYTNIKERHHDEIDFVMFGPAKFDYNIYHAVLLHFPFKENKEKYIKWLLKQKLGGRSVGLVQKHFEKFIYKNLDRYYAVYESENSFFVTCITDNGNSFFEIEIDISKNTQNPKTNLEELINRKYKIFNEMLDSFTIKSK